MEVIYDCGGRQFCVTRTSRGYVTRPVMVVTVELRRLPIAPTGKQRLSSTT